VQAPCRPKNVTLMDRGGTYAHKRSGRGEPDNDFVENLIPFLMTVAFSHR
jgi:hypothetical protein